MPNKYCNLDGTKKIKDEYKKINVGFDKVEEDLVNIIVTPAEGVSEQEIIQARKGKNTLNDRLNETDTNINTVKQEIIQARKGKGTLNDRLNETETIINAVHDNLNSRIDNIIATPTTVSEQEIIDARQGKASLGANLTAIKDDLTAHKLDYKEQSTFLANNLMKNSNFPDTSGGWESNRVGCTVSAIDNTLKIIGNGSLASPRTFGDTGIAFIENHKYYVQLEAELTNSECTNLSLIYMGTTTGIRRTLKSIPSPVQNETYIMQMIFTSNDVGDIRIGVTHDYPTMEIANGKICEIRRVILLDLTTIFGEGIEPSLEEVQEILSKFPYGWFEKQANLVNFKESYLKLLTTEQEIIDARQGKASLGANLTAIKDDLTQHKLDYETESKFLIDNILDNGDFSQGATGWRLYTVGASISANNNVLSIVGNGSNPQPRVFKDTTKQIIEKHKYYLKVKAKVSHEECNSISLLALGTTTGISRTVAKIDNPIPNNEYELSGIYEPGTTDKGTLRVGFAHQYENAATALGKIAEISYFLVLDLTDIFREGNEPTKDEIDLLIDKFPNRWFQTANLLTFKDSYLELSSKIKAINNSLQVLTPSVGFIDNPLQSEFNNQAMVTLSYDDGFLNNYNLALPLHEKYGIPATFNIITSYIASSKFMDAEKILNCHHRGVEIASHSHYHDAQLPTKTDEEIHFECSESKRILEEIIGVGKVETMAIPFSQYDDRVKSIVKQYYKGIRVYGESLNSIPPTDRYNLSSRIAVGNTTTFAQVKSAIDSAISQKKWCIIMLHGINNGTRDQYEISQRLLDEILKYIAIQGRDVLLPINTRDALKYSLGASY